MRSNSNKQERGKILCIVLVLLPFVGVLSLQNRKPKSPLCVCVCVLLLVVTCFVQTAECGLWPKSLRTRHEMRTVAMTPGLLCGRGPELSCGIEINGENRKPKTENRKTEHETETVTTSTFTSTLTLAS